MDAERQRLINEAARIANNIEQQIIDIEYWNSLHPDEEPLDPDPDGQLAQWKHRMESMLKSEAAKGNYPSVVPLKARPRRYIPIVLTDETAKMFLDEYKKGQG
jgi:hypothetical protein